MIYVISDLHGYPLGKFKKLLQKAHFSDNDFLYILGDVIDRNGDGGVEVLCWIMELKNIKLILGNHEFMLLKNYSLVEKFNDIDIDDMSNDEILYAFCNGGVFTLKSLFYLYKTVPKKVKDIFDYLRTVPLYETVSAGEKDFLLVHSGLGNFKSDRKPTVYTNDKLLWTRPDIKDVYFDDVITVFGHTPTVRYGEKYKGKILKTKTWINIDVGAAYGLKPVLLRLNDFKEFR